MLKLLLCVNFPLDSKWIHQIDYTVWQGKKHSPWQMSFCDCAIEYFPNGNDLIDIMDIDFEIKPKIVSLFFWVRIHDMHWTSLVVLNFLCWTVWPDSTTKIIIVFATVFVLPVFPLIFRSVHKCFLRLYHKRIENVYYIGFMFIGMFIWHRQNKPKHSYKFQNVFLDIYLNLSQRY